MTATETRTTVILLTSLVVISVAAGTFLTIYLIEMVVPDNPPRLDVQLNKLLEIWNPNSTHELPYQDYITPANPAIRQLSEQVDGKVEAYEIAVKWVWVSDTTLNQISEKWLMPHTFLVDTPNYPTNPATPRAASDCEEQANTLVSLLRAEGVEAGNVRVVLGTVNLGGAEGGHAWVEVYEDNQWLALEATTGPFYDDDSLKLIEKNGLPYNYYKRHNYPSLEIWFCYNDIYYVDVIHSKQNAPSHWLTTQVAGNFSIRIIEQAWNLLIPSAFSYS